MNFELTMEDYTIILNALHYYKQVEKRGQFQVYDSDRINALRDKLAYQLIPSPDSKRWTLSTIVSTLDYIHWMKLL